MLIADVMALVVPPVTDLLRRSRSRGGTNGTEPMFPTIVAVRNDRVVAAVTSPRLEITLTCAQTMAVGLGATALVLAAQADLGGSPVVGYSVMTGDRRAKFAVQGVRFEQDGSVAFAEPVDGGDPHDATILTVLAEAMAQRPVDVTRVARKDRGGTFGEELFLPSEQGRVVVDAGTMQTLHERVAGVSGEAVYVARSPEAARLALEAGLPRTSLVSAEDWRPAAG
ncbi:hypothetical protein [Ornithinimicrobium avium]|uniref:Uncharacterized protein n=1 Tax=Ornithinimicrobium avium TaxID=2283195 RepID=A0A345NRQ6_9MICO|nr:hypothetical protein [Ornithinimicrobium avium]AXH97714.1 hypothetical protein DV701_17800 [Ornithinimicrobium avium]